MIWIRELDPHPHRAGGRIEMRIDQRDLSWKPPVGIAAHAYLDRLIFSHGRELRLRDIYQRPYDGVICDPEQHITRHGSHAFYDIALKHDSVSWSEPREGQRHLPCALDFFQERFG